ncbi:unnamed protein product [Acidithrix sp. C25]|nr:unnamed protein product [Acidithrix sp. C25]
MGIVDLDLMFKGGHVICISLPVALRIGIAPAKAISTLVVRMD